MRGRRVFFLSFAAFLLFSALSLSAQSSRTDIKIYILRPESKPGIHEQEDFFAEQFKSEITAAKYTVTDNRDDADYLIQLIIEENEYWGEEDEKRYLLTPILIRAEEGTEVVRFSWPFTDMTEMYQWNLFLVYEAMANVPMTKELEEGARTIVEKEVVPERDDRWRNKWVYFNFSAGADMTYLVRRGTTQTEQGMVTPSALVGVEFHFMDKLSLELDVIRARMLHDMDRYYLIYGPSAALKWVFKPEDFLMIEPYAGAEYGKPLTGTDATGLMSLMDDRVPWLSGIAGVQVGMRGGDRGAIVLDLGVSYSLLGNWRLNGRDRDYGTMRFSFSVGYKLGFLDRKKTPAAGPGETVKTTETPDAPEAAPVAGTPGN
ncbi:MAG: hypothetical protein LBG84_10665 [Treponema sp.]|nr:hypothetical protein [Treponema sp.]